MLIKKLLPAALTAAISSTAIAAEISTQDWVSQVYQQRGDTTLRQMVIPGTHLWCG